MIQRIICLCLTVLSAATFAAPLTPNPQIVQGVLPNGVRYLIQPNRQPANKIEFRLVMAAGANGETEQQRGYAHFVEHMAFEHTRHFQKERAGQFIESLGMRIGPDSNAYTSFNETVYMLPVPSKNDQQLKKAVTLLADWVDGITFRPADALNESRIITEEWRLSEHSRAQLRPSEKVLYAGSRYLDRAPIGDMQQIAAADVKQLEDYYRREYRPERATIIAVGDIEPTKLAKLIKQVFGQIPARQPLMPPVVPPLTLEQLPTTVVMSHDSLQTPMIKWMIPSGVIPVRDEKIVDEGLAIQMAQALIQRRLAIQAEKAEFPISASTLMTNELMDRRDNTTFIVVPREQQLLPAWHRLQQEIARAANQGFTEAEYTEVKLNLLNQMRQTVVAQKAENSDALADSLVHDVLQQNVSIAPEEMLRLTQQWFETNQLSAINAAFRQIVATPKKMLTVMLPPAMPLATIQPDQFAIPSDLTALPAWQEAAVGSLLTPAPTAGQILSKTQLAPGVYRYRLSNQSEVIVQPTHNNPGNVSVNLYAAGGLYPVGPEAFTTATLLDDVLNRSGVGDYSLSQLSKMTAGQLLSSHYWVGSNEQGLTGSARTEDLTTLFALMYRQLTQPRVDTLVLNEIKQDTIKSWQQSRQHMSTFLVESLGQKIWHGDYRKTPATPAQIQAVDPEGIHRLANQLFVNAGPWKMVIVGDLDLAKVEPLLTTWIASLPAKEAQVSPVRLQAEGGFHEVKENTADTQKFDASDRSSTFVFVRAPADFSFENRLINQLLEDVLQQRLENQLRQTLSLVYAVGVNTELRRSEGFRADIEFSSKAETAEQALKVTKQLIADLVTNGVTEAELSAAKQRVIRIWEDAAQKDDTIAATLLAHLQYQEPLKSIKDRIDLLAHTTPALINERLKQWLDARWLSSGQVYPYGYQSPRNSGKASSH